MHGGTFLETNCASFVIISIPLMCSSQLNFLSTNNPLYYEYFFSLVSSSLVFKFILSVSLFLLRLNIKTFDSSRLDVSSLPSSQFNKCSVTLTFFSVISIVSKKVKFIDIKRVFYIIDIY